MLDTGAQGVVLDVEKGMDRVFQAAVTKQQNDWNKYLQFQKNLQEFYADAAKVAEVDMLAEDKQEVMKKYGDWVAEAGEDPMALMNPLSNPQKYAELTQKGAQVMALAQKSKQDKAFDQFHRQFVLQNPEFNTQDNKAIISSFRNTPLEQRKAYSLAGPAPSFDIVGLAEEWNKEGARKKSTTIPTGAIVKGKDGKETVGKGDQYLTTETLEYVDPESFARNAEAAWTMQDKYGNPLSAWAKTYIYDPLSATEKERLAGLGGDPVKNAYMEYVSLLRKPESRDLKQGENPVWAEKNRSATQERIARINASTRGPAAQPKPDPASFDLWSETRDRIKSQPGMKGGVGVVGATAARFINSFIQGRLGPTQKFQFSFDRDTQIRYDDKNDKIFVEARVGDQTVDFELMRDDINVPFVTEVTKDVSGAGELGTVISTIEAIKRQSRGGGSGAAPQQPRRSIVDEMKNASGGN